MDGMHDLGGTARLRPCPLHAQCPGVPRSLGECGSTRSMRCAVRLGIFNMDEYRHAIERMEPRHYLSASYYERSLTSLATLCVEKGILTQEELERRAQGAFPLSMPSAPGRSNVATRERFKPGDTVRVRSRPHPGPCPHAGLHPRQDAAWWSSESPAYPFPDAHAHGVDAEDEPTYDVRFNSRGAVAQLRRSGAGPCRRLPELPRARGIAAQLPAPSPRREIKFTQALTEEILFRSFDPAVFDGIRLKLPQALEARDERVWASIAVSNSAACP